MPRWFRNFVLALAVMVGATFGLTACGSDPAPVAQSPVQDGTPAPAAFVSKVDGKTYCAWVNNSHECDDSGYPPAPFAMPTEDPQTNRASYGRDYDLLEDLFLYHVMYHSYFNNPWYYNSFISPAWAAYPGTYYGWGGHPVTRITTVNNYTTTVNKFDSVNAKTETKLQQSAKYTDKATGKTYNGNTVPASKFSGTNAKPNAAGKAPAAGSGKSGTAPNAGKPGTGGKAGTPPAAGKPAAPKAPSGRSSSGSGRSSSGSGGRSGGRR
jgi:hypothetical protein